MKFVAAFLFVLTTYSTVAALKDGEVMRLWTNAAPGARGETDKDIPTLTVALPAPEKATGAAMVICPGGAYASLAGHEGDAYAQWLRDHGITCFVLKYRLGSSGYRHPVPFQDASRAIRLVRANAPAWNLDPKRIGIIGSSAGGHLASTVLTHFDSGKADAEDSVERHSNRPDLGILCYPVITMGEMSHGGSRRNLLGDNPSPELIADLSNELRVSAHTPPCFLFHTVADKPVPVENTLLFAAALRRAGVPMSVHIYENGEHGVGLGFKPYATYDLQRLHPWTANCIFWLKERGFVK